jgi:dUTP pyrophosphatase
MRIGVMRLPHAEGLDLPHFATAGAAGADIRAAVGEDLRLPAGARLAVPTGLCFEVPSGCEVQVRPRSGLAIRHGVTVVNAPGTIDSDYRGEVMILLVNLGAEDFVIRRGDRIAQLVAARVSPASYVEANELATTERGAGGFGSTGSR